MFGELDLCLIGVDYDLLCLMYGFLVVSGSFKCDVVCVVLCGGFVNYLVVDLELVLLFFED